MMRYSFIALFCILIPYCTCLLTNAMIGPGRWLVIHITNCPEDEQYLFRFDINRRKVNRTHDGFNGWMELDKDFDQSYGILVEICKHVDGGCKPYQVLTDNSCCNFMEKFAKENVEKLLIESGLPNNVCHVPAGKHKISNFVFDYQELPENGIYGLFGAKMYALQDGQAVSCVDMTVKFDSNDD